MELIERIFPLFMRFYLNCETNWCVEFNKKWIPFVNSLSFAEYIELNNLITFSSFQKRKQAANKKERISLFVFTFFCYQLLINLKVSNTKIGKKWLEICYGLLVIVYASHHQVHTSPTFFSTLFFSIRCWPINKIFFEYQTKWRVVYDYLK